MEKYLQILADSLMKKSSIMTALMQESNKQGQIVSAEVVDWNAFDQSVDQKGELIEELEKLDDGFEVMYAHIKEGLNQNRESYKQQIQEIQKLIIEVTEKSSQLMAIEERNKTLVSNRFSVEKRKFKQQKVSSRAANNYYNTMKQINYIDPQLMDQKK